MKGPGLATLLLGTLSLLILFRAARRFLRDAARHSSNPREMRLSIVSGVILGLILLGLGSLCLGTVAGLSRYRPLDPAVPPALTVLLEGEEGRVRFSSQGLGRTATMEPILIEEGWFSILAQRVVWRGPLRWAGFPDSLRPYALLSARSRGEIGRPDRTRREVVSPENLFEIVLKSPASTLGLWSLDEVRTPWRPTRAGRMECFFTEKGPAVISP